jgi:hypothetical protein
MLERKKFACFVLKQSKFLRSLKVSWGMEKKSQGKSRAVGDDEEG